MIILSGDYLTLGEETQPVYNKQVALRFCKLYLHCVYFCDKMSAVLDLLGFIDDETIHGDFSFIC